MQCIQCIAFVVLVSCYVLEGILGPTTSPLLIVTPQAKINHTHMAFYTVDSIHCILSFPYLQRSTLLI